MHQPPKPRELGLYRLAASSLFRALLRQSTSIPSLTDASRDAVQNIVRNRFRANASLVSVHHLKIAYIAGYHGLDILDDCANGSTEACTKLLDLVDSTPTTLKEPPLPRRNKAQRKRDRLIAEGIDPSSFNPAPPGRRMLDLYPRPTVKGKRRVPYFAAATTVPFLRIKKPQARALSSVIKGKLQQRHGLLLRRRVLENYYRPLAQWEDDWDNHMVALGSTAGGRASANKIGPPDQPWTHEVEQQVREVRAIYTADTKARLDMGKRMWDIVEEEKRLAYEEQRAWEAKAKLKVAIGT